MATSFRHFFRAIKRSNNFNRNITMSSQRYEKAVEKLQQNPYYEKYADRIAKLQQTSPEEFMARLEAKEQAKEKERQTKFSTDLKQFSSALNPKEALKDNVTTPQDKKLEDILKLDLVKDKSALEIQTIWEEYHKNKEVISATIPNEIYADVNRSMKQLPIFLFPLPRSDGYEFIMCQIHGHAVHFTPLLAFQVHKENAPECLTMVHYTELQDKGVILMRGEYDKNVLTGQEAQCLANQFQMYFSGKDQKKYQLLEKFNKHPDTFKHMEIIEELENITLS